MSDMIDKAIGGTALEESVKALQDVFVDHDLVEKEEPMSDLISRQAAIDALWKAMYEYEDEMEKQFIESDDLDIEEWILHRIFVQNMSDIDRKAIFDLPSAQPEIVRCKDCKHRDHETNFCHGRGWPMNLVADDDFCSMAERKENGSDL